MNNKMYLLVIFLMFLFGCGNNQSSNAVVKEKQRQMKSDYSGVRFVADTTINNKLLLDNYQSIDNYFGRKSDFKLVEQLRSSPVVVFINKGKKEYLLAYQYEGGAKNAFSCFEIGSLYELQHVASVNIAQIGFDKFITESGLSLGESMEDVKRIKGNNFTETLQDNEKVINYKIDNIQSSFLKRYNMPSYFLRISFDKTEKVKNIIFGFDYP